MARPTKKPEAAAQVIRRRIIHGDHVLHGIPGERQLALELGISRETLRRAIELLEKEGLLLRQSNGRLEVAHGASSAEQKPIIGFVKHTSSSPDFALWHRTVCAVLEGRNCAVRTVTFEHYGDANIASALNGFDGMFFLPTANKIPDWLAEKMHNSRCRVVVLDQDATDAGLPSVVMFPLHAERKLLEHLVELGHQRIDCINTQVRDQVIEARITTWREFLAEKGLQGKLHDLTESRPMNSAYRLVKYALEGPRASGMASALLCTTGPAAIGAIRAFYDAGFEVGKDVSICAINDESFGPYLMPSLTSLQIAPRGPYLQTAANWLLGIEGAEWQGPLLVQPDNVPMFIGGSTGRPSAQSLDLRGKSKKSDT